MKKNRSRKALSERKLLPGKQQIPEMYNLVVQFQLIVWYPMKINNKIHLEEITLSMAPVIFDTIDRDRNYLRQWLPFVDFTREVSDTELFIKGMLSEKTKRKDEIFTIWYNMEFAGLIGFKDTDWVNNKTELGYWLAENMQGKGIITLSTAKLVRYAFKRLGMNRVQIKVATGNDKSAAVPRRLGFQFEGVERHGEFINGIYHDLQIFSLLKHEKIVNTAKFI